MAKAPSSKRFVWVKKIQREIDQGIDVKSHYSHKAEKKRQLERMSELETVKKRKLEMEVDKERRERRAEFQDREWERKEAEFLFHQTKIRSQIRLREGRPRPIDLLLNYLTAPADDDPSYSALVVFEGLTPKELDQLQDEIRLLLHFDRANAEYWDALLVLCSWELAEARKKDDCRREDLFAEEKKLLRGKTRAELEALRSQIESDMRAGTAKVVEYWEAILKLLPVFKAKACLKDIHAQMLLKRSQCLQQPVEGQDRLDSTLAVIPEEKSAEDFVRDQSFSPELLHKRKPKYHNRVHTGYEWNKYNRIHYDHDNPPPKAVLGYKFCIFYPDLVASAPTYRIEKDDNDETCTIHFSAGPPYEDVAFQIVNKEWEYSRKKGFKCIFEHGVLQLNFNFKRHPYRR